LSYRTFKRVLGESNLERKCRRLFGACLLLLITGSFWWYGRETDEIVYDLNRFVGKALVYSAMMEAHSNAIVDEEFQNANQQLSRQLRSRAFSWEVLYRNNLKGVNEPTDDFEWGLMEKWERFGQQLKGGRPADKEIDEAFENPDFELGQDRPGGDRTTYTYYQPVFAKRGCAECHAFPGSGGQLHLPNLEVGELMAIVRVKMETNTQNA
jgi:hypothetical protein